MKLFKFILISLILIFSNNLTFNSHEYSDKYIKSKDMHNEIPFECYEDGTNSNEPMCKG